MTIYCPACDAPNVDESKSCSKCGVLTHIDDRYVLREPAPVVAGEDVVDRASSLRVGHDIDDDVEIAIRIASIGTKARLNREATILKGLQSPSVPTVVATTSIEGAGTALILSPPPFETLQAQVADGLRIDDKRARALIGALLNGLRALHRVSPPVFHRNIHPGTVAWDGASGVHFLDFARATDTVHDAETDLVAARPGYSPRESTTPAQQDLYGIGATVAHVLSRRAISDLPLKSNGAPDIRPAIVVSDDVEVFLEALLCPSAKGAPQSLEEAQTLWDATTRAPVSPRVTSDRSAPVNASPKSAAMVSLVFAGIAVAVGAVGFFVVVQSDPAEVAVSHATSSKPVAAAGKWGHSSGSSVGKPTPPAPPASTSAPNSGANLDTNQKPLAAKTKHRRRRTSTPAAPSPAATFRKKLAGTKTALMACDDPANERIRLKVSIAANGRVEKTTEIGRTRGNGAACVSGVVRKLSIPSAMVSTKLTLDVWVWTHPNFKITVF